MADSTVPWFINIPSQGPQLYFCCEILLTYLRPPSIPENIFMLTETLPTWAFLQRRSPNSGKFRKWNKTTGRHLEAGGYFLPPNSIGLHCLVLHTHKGSHFLSHCGDISFIGGRTGSQGRKQTSLVKRNKFLNNNLRSSPLPLHHCKSVFFVALL